MVPLERLTEDQLDAVQASTQQHRVVIGGPGSGKSLVLIHRAQRLIANGCAADRVKLIVFTKVLSSYLQQASLEIGLPGDFVVNFDRWCRSVYLKLVSTKVPALNTPDDWKRMRASVLTALRDKPVEPMFDAVLVDEGQDLTDEALEILRRCSRHLTVALDVRQDLFNTEVTVTRACDLLNVPRPSANLLTAYRCTPLIVALAAEFLSSEEERNNFRSANLLPLDGVERPVAFRWSTEKEEFDELALRLAERALEGQATAVLLPTQAIAQRYARALGDRHMDVQLLTGSSTDESDFDFMCPVITTYHSVKGLTVDSVFLPGLSQSNFSMPFLAETARKRRLMFVGVTRATKWVWMGIPESGPLAEVANLVERAKSASLGGLVVMRSSGSLEDSPVKAKIGNVTRGAASATESDSSAQAISRVPRQKPAVRVAPNPRQAVKRVQVQRVPRTSGASAAVKKTPMPAKASARKPTAKPSTQTPDQSLTDLL